MVSVKWILTVSSIQDLCYNVYFRKEVELCIDYVSIQMRFLANIFSRDTLE